MVYSEEKSGTTPMLETTILRSLRVHLCADQVFDFGDVLFRHFDARAGWDLEIDGELAGVGLGKNAKPKKRIDGQAG